MSTVTANLHVKANDSLPVYIDRSPSFIIVFGSDCNFFFLVIILLLIAKLFGVR